MELPFDSQDVTTLMAMIGDIRHDIHRIKVLLEEEDGEEEAPENNG